MDGCFDADGSGKATYAELTLPLYIVMGCGLASFQTRVTERPNDPYPLTVSEGLLRCQRQGDGAVGMKATELPRG